jgi:hypothetical protein
MLSFGGMVSTTHTEDVSRVAAGPGPQSNNCGERPRGSLMRCGGCLLVFYCSERCHVKAWPAHKPACRAEKARRAAAAAP